MSLARRPPSRHPCWESNGGLIRRGKDGDAVQMQCLYSVTSEDGAVKKCEWSQGQAFANNADRHLKSHLKKSPDDPLLRAYEKKLLEYQRTEKKAAVEQGPMDGFASRRKIPIKWDVKKNEERALQKRIDRIFGAFLASAIHVPYSIGQNPFFRELMEAGLPKWSLPQKTKAAALAKEFGKEVKAGLLEKLHRAVAAGRVHFFSATTDLWTAPTGTPMIGLKGYWWDWPDGKGPESGRPEEAVLALRHLPYPHTSQRVAEAFLEIISDIGLGPEHIFRVITDSGQNMVRGFCLDLQRLVKLKESEGGEELDDDEEDEEGDEEGEEDDEEEEEGELRERIGSVWAPCYVHKLQCVVTDGYKLSRSATATLLRSLRTFMRQFRHRKPGELLKASPFAKALLLPNATRWSSVWLMLERLLEAKAHLPPVLAAVELDNLRQLEWKAAEEVHSILSGFAESTRLQQADTAASPPTLSRIIPDLLVLEESLALAEPSTAAAQQLLEQLKKGLVTRFLYLRDEDSVTRAGGYSAFDPAPLGATLLDPRFCNLLSADDVAKAKVFILKTLRQIRPKPAASAPGRPGQSSSSTEPSASAPSSPRKRVGGGNEAILAALLEAKKAKASESATRQSAADVPEQKEMLELESYLAQLPSIQMSQSPVDWWRTEGAARLPSLAYLAFQLSVCPASSGGSERIFSLSGAASANRFRLDNSSLELETIVLGNAPYAIKCLRDKLILG